MGAAARVDDVKTLATFIPLNELDNDKLGELAAKSNVRQFKAGDSLQAHTQHKQLHYLLSGTIELNPHSANAEQIKAGSDRALRPVCPQTADNCRAIAKTAVSLLVIDVELLELLQGWGHTNSHYEVDEIETDGSDWMSSLLQNPALIKLTPTTLQKLITTIEPVEVKAGESVLRQGERDNHYYIIARGHCSVSRRPQPGAKEITLATLGPGDGFGEEALITGAECNANVSATEPSLILKLGSNSFTALLQQTLVQLLPYEAVARLKEEGAETLDIRSPERYARDGVGINLPLSELRLKAPKLARNKKYVACCEDGKKSTVAAFVLSQQGLDVYVLDGGLAPYTATHREMKKPATPIINSDVVTIHETKSKQDESRISELNTKIETLNNTLIAKQQEIEHYEKEEKNTHLKMTELERSLEKAQIQANNITKEAAANHTKKESHLNNVVADLQQQLVQEKKQTHTLRQEQANNKKKMTELTQTLAILETELAHEKEKHQTTQTTLSAQQRKHEALSRKIGTLQHGFDIAINDKQTAETSISDLQRKLAQIEQKYSDDKRVWNEEKHAFTMRLQEQQQRSDAAEREVTEAHHQIKTLHSTIEKQETDHTQLTHDIDSAREIGASLKQSQNKLIEKLNETEEQLASITRKFSESAITIEQLKESKNRITIELEEKNRSLESLAEKIDTNQADHQLTQALQKEIEKLTGSITEKDALIASLQSDIKKLTEQVQSLKEDARENVSRTNDIDEKEKIISKQRQHLEKQKIEIKSNKENQYKLENQLGSLKKEIRSLRDELHTSRHKQTQAEKTIQTLKAREKKQTTAPATQSGRLDSFEKLIAQAPTVDNSISQRISDAELIKMGKQALSEPIPTFSANQKSVAVIQEQGYVKPQLKSSVKVTLGLALAASIYLATTHLLGINIGTQVTAAWQSLSADQVESKGATTTALIVKQQNKALFLTQEEKLKQAAKTQLEQALKRQP